MLLTRHPQATARAARATPTTAALALALTAAALLVLTGWAAVRNADTSLVEESLRRLDSTTEATGRAVETEQQDLLQALAAAAQLPDVVRSATDPAARDAARDELAALAYALDAPATWIGDPAGVNLVIHPDQRELVGKDFSFRDWFRGVSGSGRPYVSEAYRSAATGRPLVVAGSVPVKDRSGHLVGYLTALWSLQDVHATVSAAQRDQGIAVEVTDQRGQSLEAGPAALDERGEPVHVTPSDQVLGLLRTGADRESDGPVLRSGRRLASGWTVTSSLSRSDALAPGAAMRRWTRAVVSAGLVAVVLVAGLILRAARRRALEARASEEEHQRLEALFASSPVGIIEGHADGTVVAVNQAMADMLGYTREEVLVRNARELAHPRSAPGIAGAMQQVLEGSLDSYTCERSYLAKDGSEVPALVSLIVLRRQGEPDRLVAFVADLRAQRADAEALRAMSTQLQRREQFLNTLVDTMGASVLACDADGRLTLVNRRARELHAIPDAEAVDDLSAFHLTDVTGHPLTPDDSPLRRALTEGRVTDAELLVHPRSGASPRRLLVHAKRLEDAEHQVLGAVVVGHDVTALREAETTVRASERRFRQLFDQGMVGKALLALDGRVVLANEALGRLVGVRAEALVERQLEDLLVADEGADTVLGALRTGRACPEQELRLVTPDASEVVTAASLTWVDEPDGSRHAVLQLQDVTARKVAEHRLTELALHDELTGLPNRRLLMERCRDALTAARRRGPSTVSLLFLDLDGFKAVNDRGGHDAGDAVLKGVACDLLGVVRPHDLVARIGGDEFVVLVTVDEGLQHLRSMADRLARTVRRDLAVDGTTLPLSASIGIVRADARDEPDLTAEQLLRRADVAMYRSKDTGRDRTSVFDSGLQDDLDARLDVERHLRRALDEGSVEVGMQPVVEVDTGRVVGAEALLRLQGADGRPLSAAVVVAAAEGGGLHERLGDAVLRRALDIAAQWPSHLDVAVNVSARELTGHDFRQRVSSALARSGVDPSRLVLEITETSLLAAGPSAVAELRELRAKGVRIALDDFGTAYATLKNLTELPVDLIKVDASFTAGLPHQQTHTAVVHGVLAMAYELGVPCVVEGVETMAQLEALRGLSAYAQGYLLGFPKVGGGVPQSEPLPVLEG